MSSRNRARANNPNQDADEERRLWKEIKDKAKEVDSLVARSNEIGNEIIQVEGQQAALLESGKTGSAALDEQLEKLYRENVRLSEEVQHIIEGKSNDMNLLDSIKILAGLREASEESAAQASASQSQRSASNKLSRPTKKTKTFGSVASSTEEMEDVAAAPSPRISINGSRLVKDKNTRAGSIPATRETSVKIEDGESVASSADGASSVTTTVGGKNAMNRASARVVLRLGEIVFCRHDSKNHDGKKGEPLEGEGILCRVTAVIGEGKQRRYEIQDADTSGEAPPPQRASISQLIQIPENNKGLSDLSKGKAVIAQYPDTTTFYKAEVNEIWRSRELVGNEKGEFVKLNFQDDELPREVERRFVLTEK